MPPKFAVPPPKKAQDNNNNVPKKSFCGCSSTSVMVCGAILVLLGLIIVPFTFIGFDFHSIMLVGHESDQHKKHEASSLNENHPKLAIPPSTSPAPKTWAEIFAVLLSFNKHEAEPAKQFGRRSESAFAALEAMFFGEKNKVKFDLDSNYTSIFHLIYKKSQKEASTESYQEDLTPITSEQLKKYTHSLSPEERQSFATSMQKVAAISDDLDDEEYEKNHPFSKHRKEDSGPPCILFRDLPNCSCSADGVKGGSMCGHRGLGRCEFGKCFHLTLPVAKTLRLGHESNLFQSKTIHAEDFESSSPSRLILLNNILNNYYFAATTTERVFRTKLDLANQNADIYIQKIQHLCREQRLAAGNSVPQLSSSEKQQQQKYRCRAELYPFNPTQIDAKSLRSSGRKNSPHIRKLYQRESPIFLRFYCTTDSRMGITNVDLSFGGCLSLAIDVMTRDPTIVVDVVMPSKIDHRDHQREWFVDIFDWNFLTRIAKAHGVNVIMSPPDGDWKPELHPNRKGGGMNMRDGCENCIWRENLPVHCFGCCVADSRVLGGKSLILNTALSYSERSLPVDEMERQRKNEDPKLNPNITSNPDDVFFSVFGGKNIVQQINQWANFSISPFMSFADMSDAEFTNFTKSVRTLDYEHWYANEQYLKDRYNQEMRTRRHMNGNRERERQRIAGIKNEKPKAKHSSRRQYDLQALASDNNDNNNKESDEQSDKEANNRAQIDAKRWLQIDTPDSDWNWCLNNKLERLPGVNGQSSNEENSRRRVLIVDESQTTITTPESTKEMTKKDNKNKKDNKKSKNNKSPSSPPPANFEKKQRHDIRVNESYLLSIRVTGLHFTTFLEERSASWLPGLDWLQPSKRARIDAQNAINKILSKSLDGKTFLAVHLRYEEDAFVWTVGVRNSPQDEPGKNHDVVSNEKFSVLDRWREANKDRVGGRNHRNRHPLDKPDQNTFNLMAHMKKLLNQIDKLSQDLNVGAVFISNDAPIEEFNKRYDQESALLAQAKTFRDQAGSSGIDKKELNFLDTRKRRFVPWFSGASFFDKSRERTRYGSLIDRLIIESSTVAVVWDPFTGLSSFSQKIYDHRCRRMRGLTTFSYSIGVGQERDESLVLEC